MPNRLASEKSPYLLQHKDNPVQWFPWSSEALETARREDKPIFLSVGYSTCYWCHVMEHDSFERDEVAQLLNRYFISIKVDREERPDVDKLYMDAVVGFTGRGGWPMSVFLTPDLKPFFGATFFWRAQFISLIEQIAEHWRTNRVAVTESADDVLRFLQQEEPRLGRRPGEELLVSACRQLGDTYDPLYGGFGSAPKFPPAEKIRLLLRLHRRSGNAEVLKLALETLAQMMRGGLLDQVGGGFHRYSTDDRWLVPHFEKMLYDNALLPTAYLEAHQVAAVPGFARVARLTLDYILEVLAGVQGEIFSAEDAGDVEKEGDFYLWHHSELESALIADELRELRRVFSIQPEGNFEGRTILAYRPGVPFEDREHPLVQAALAKLKTLRSRRTRPHLDDKVLTAWMSLALSALIKGYAVLGDERYLSRAKAGVDFISTTLLKGAELHRRFREGHAAILGYLDDYAFYIQALLDLYQQTGDNALLETAERLQTAQDELFWDKTSAGYYYSRENDPAILVRKKEFQDGAEPSANGTAALNLLRLSSITGKQEYYRRAEEIFSAVAESVDRYPSGFAGLLIALDFYLDQAKQVAVISNCETEMREKLRRFANTEFLPNLVILFAENDQAAKEAAPALLQGKTSDLGKTTAYICEHLSCREPLENLEQIQSALRELRPLELSWHG